MRRWIGAALAIGIGASGCYDGHGREGDAGFERDGSRVDADAPRVLEERCELAWAREIPVPDTTLGLVMDLAVVTVDGEERVLASYFAGASFVTDDGVRHEAGLYLGTFDARTGEGALVSTEVFALASVGDRVIASAWDDVDAQRARFVELDPRSGRELRTLGTAFVDSVRDLDAASIGGTDLLSFSVFESFGMTAPTPRTRSSQVVLRSDGPVLTAMSIGPQLGALLLLDDGPTFFSGPEAQLCADGVCSGAIGDRHVVRADGSVESAVDGGRTFATRQRAASRLTDGTWLELDVFGLVQNDTRGAVLHQQDVPADFNVFVLGVDGDGAVAVTQTSIEGGPHAFEGTNVALPDLASRSELLVTWSVPSLVPLHHARVVTPDDSRSGLGFMRVGASGRIYVTAIADPLLEICGRTFERSIFVIALD